MDKPKNSIHSHDINARHPAHGRTALCQACKEGDYDTVKILLLSNKLIDISLEDDSGLSPLEHAVKGNHYHCAGLIMDEAYRRSNGTENEFIKTLRLDLDNAKSFDEDLFRLAIENDPKAATKYLDQFFDRGDYTYSFTNLQDIFGHESVKSSALASVLNDSILSSQVEDKLDCLQHVVLKRILDIKWELFAARKYYQQLLLYILMLMAITNGVLCQNVLNDLYEVDGSNGFVITEAWLKDFKEQFWMPLSLIVWICTIVYGIVASIHLVLLKPQPFLKLTRFMYDGKYKLDPSFTIPYASVFKAKARSWLFYSSILCTVLIAAPLIYFMQYRLPDYNIGIAYSIVTYNILFSFAVLWLCALYFFILEVRELLGEDPWIFDAIESSPNCIYKVFWVSVMVFLPLFTPFMPSYRKYYASFTNKLQITTYLIILVPYPIFYWNFHLSRDAYMVCGAFSTISLWMLSLQYLEVNRTAGYLLPIVRDVVADVWNFLIFYGVFQCGLTCAFYYIFRGSWDDYVTLWASFRATYFVMYGENGIKDIREQKMDSATENLGLVFRMFQCAVMVVLLLNLLVAMMNKTVDRNWEKLQSRALTSYARAVLRLETITGHTATARAKLIHISTSHGVPFLHPIFNEKISRQELEPENSTKNVDDPEALAEKISQLTKDNKLLETRISALKTSMQSQFQEFNSSMHDQVHKILLSAQKIRRS